MNKAASALVTGGGDIIIGLAAGVAVMGIEKISFGWCLKRVSLLALLGFAAGGGWYSLRRRRRSR